ncbi:MAG TPA: hypothetical protein VMY37_37415 [Thermoguttaceae bacterium]|nr:hypothetical protein [Thermoguttaceae bacterium]
MTRRAGWILLIVANVLFCCVLSFYRTTEAAPPKSKEPFANSVEQRMETINELREIKLLLKEQNALLRSGEVKVVVVEPKPK